MNIKEKILLDSIVKQDVNKVINMKPQRGIYISGLCDCNRASWFKMNKPKNIQGMNLEYFDEDRNGQGDYICELGNKIEDIMEYHIKSNGKMHFVDKQVAVKDFNGKVRGRIDFAVFHPKLGTGILDCKGMSDSVFKRFINTRSLKEFKEEYYAQVVYYINSLNTDFGAIVGVNRSSGEVALKLVNTKDTVEDFNNYRLKCYNIINATIDNFLELPVDKNNCTWCQFNYICSNLKD